MSGIGVISNPYSNRNRRNPRLARKLAFILGEKHHMAEPDHIDNLIDVAKQMKDHNIDMLCINGGDGSAHKVLSAFLKVYDGAPLPMITLLRGGTLNTLAGNIGLKGEPEDILGRVVTAYHADEPFSFVERNLLVVDNEQAGFLFGNGLISSFLEEFYKTKNPGPGKAAQVLGKAAFSALINGEFSKKLTRPVYAHVQFADGTSWEENEFTAVGAGTMPDIGIGFHAFYDALKHPDHMHALGFACPLIDIAKGLPRMRMHVSLANPNIHEKITRSMTLESESPISYMVDGDFHHGGKTIHVDVGPRVKLIVI